MIAALSFRAVRQYSLKMKRLKEKLIKKINKTQIGNQLVNNTDFRVVTFAVFGLVFNLIYAFYNGALGILNHSVWFITSCVYYLLLSTMRFSAILFEKKNGRKSNLFITKSTGVLLSVLSFILTIIIYISISNEIATEYHEIVMITIALFTFIKLTLSIIKAVKSKGNHSTVVRAIRNIGYAEVAVSVLTMQRSMLVSFGEMNVKKSIALNMFTGAGVCFFIFALGITMLKGNKPKGE